MAWKPKEKELSAEEAVEEAIAHLKPFWHGSPPLICGAKVGNKINAQPLDPAITKGAWFLFFADPTDFSGKFSLAYLREFQNRYEDSGVKFLWIFKPHYKYLTLPRTVEQMTKKNQIRVPVVVDDEGHLSAAFGTKDLPKVVLLNDGKVMINGEGSNWMDGTEAALQKFLRVNDPGLSFLYVFKPMTKFSRDIGHVEFGTGRGIVITKEAMKPQKVGKVEISIKGQWTQDEDKIFTSDPTATVSFTSPGAGVSLMAQSITRDQEWTSFVIETNGVPVHELNRGPDLGSDDDGRSMLRVEAVGLYHATSGLPDTTRSITLRFPQAKRVPAGLLGLRFSEAI